MLSVDRMKCAMTRVADGCTLIPRLVQVLGPTEHLESRSHRAQLGGGHC